MSKAWFGNMCGERAPRGETTCAAPAEHGPMHRGYVERGGAKLLYMWPRGAARSDVRELEKKLEELQAEIQRLKGG